MSAGMCWEMGENPAVSGALDVKALDALFNPAQYLGAAGEMIDRVLAAHKMKTPRQKKKP